MSSSRHKRKSKKVTASPSPMMDQVEWKECFHYLLGYNRRLQEEVEIPLRAPRAHLSHSLLMHQRTLLYSGLEADHDQGIKKIICDFMSKECCRPSQMKQVDWERYCLYLMKENIHYVEEVEQIPMEFIQHKDLPIVSKSDQNEGSTKSSRSFSDVTTSTPSGHPLLSLIKKRLRALRKKFNRILRIEESLAQGNLLNKEQKGLFRSKPIISALIDELENLCQPLGSPEEMSVALQSHSISANNATCQDQKKATEEKEFRARKEWPAETISDVVSTESSSQVDQQNEGISLEAEVEETPDTNNKQMELKQFRRCYQNLMEENRMLQRELLHLTVQFSRDEVTELRWLLQNQRQKGIVLDEDGI